MDERRNFSYHDFSHLDLSGQDFSGANLTGANFSHAILRQANFSGAILRHVNFTGADMQGAQLQITKHFSTLTLSPDGKFLACLGADDARAWLWDTELRTATRLAPSKVSGLKYIALGTDARFMETWNKNDSPVSLWETLPVQMAPSEPEKLVRVLQLLFSPDSRWLVCVYANQVIEIWDVMQRQCSSRLEIPYQSLAPVRISPDSHLLVIFTRQPQRPGILLWDIEQASYKYELPTPDKICAFSPDSKLLATGGHSVNLWDTTTGAFLRQFPILQPEELTFHASGQTLFVLADRLYQVHLATGELLDPQPQHYPGHLEQVSDIKFSPDSRLLVTGDNLTIEVWEMPEARHVRSFQGHGSIFSPDGAYLVTFTTEVISLWDTQTWQQIRVLKPAHKIDKCVFSSDGHLLLTHCGEEKIDETLVWFGSGNDVYMEDSIYRGNLTVFQLESGKILWPEISQKMKQAAIWYATFDPDGHFLLLISETEYEPGKQFWMWDLTNEPAAGQKWTWEEVSRSTFSLEYPWLNPPILLARSSAGGDQKNLEIYSPDGCFMARSAGRHVNIWNRQQQVPITTTQEPPKPETISPADHDRLVALRADRVDENWTDLLKSELQVEQDKLEQKLIAHKESLAQIAGSSQGISFQAHARRYRAFEPIQRVLALTYNDGTLHVFHESQQRHRLIHWKAVLEECNFSKVKGLPEDFLELLRPF